MTYPNLVIVYDDPIADFAISPNNVSMFEPVVNLIDQSSPDVTVWNWTITGGSPAVSTDEGVNNVSYPYDTPGTYPVILYVENAFGCFDTIRKDVNVISDIILYAPNTFTPDDDEFNQTWKFYISGIDIYDFDLFIYNRWGEVIWESHDPNVGWDGTYAGKIVQEGTYNWVMRVADAFNDDQYTFEGHINVIK
jgi:gliding motility-associated-like protein